ncbi:hypothetical protein ICW40_13015 [Actinotalea ferrariae]|uniref:hypothetical protein n=1 Tax=Actinotalea ferrariae TaxID=1386098 RepID=UPI001C8CD80F|nr:hypothetical protein [Actinotalea ferrariae]MBX9245724.1 hypothetical protein [Actinotalea ferrariae]
MSLHAPSPTSAPAPAAGTDAAPAAARATSSGRRPRAWAVTGAVAGLLGAVSMEASMRLGENWEQTAGDPDAIVADLAGRIPTLLVFHTATVLAAVLAIVFAAGLRRRLAERLPAASLLPTVALGGLLLVSVAGLMGSGLDTQFLFALGEPTMTVASSVAFWNEWLATISWLWVGAGVAGVALAVAALRHRAAPRWIGWVSVVLGGLTLLLGVSPLQYMAGMTGPLWMLVVALGFAVGDRR